MRKVREAFLEGRLRRVQDDGDSSGARQVLKLEAIRTNLLKFAKIHFSHFVGPLETQSPRPSLAVVFAVTGTAIAALIGGILIVGMDSGALIFDDTATTEN